VAPLRAEGLTDFELLAVTAWDQSSGGPNWEDHAVGYDDASFPIMPDTNGVYYIYAADYYDALLVDKKGRLAHKDTNFSDEMIDNYKTRIRALYAE
jgi:hypothetical protein